jgi:hypothetical protein
MRFDLNFKSEDHLNLYLKHLGLSKEGPSLSYLDKIIFAHQHKVPFETYTRITDYHNYLDHLMPMPVYIERLELGCGGVCWTLARGFHWLLKHLGFDTQYFYMDPGHVCVVVKLPEEIYYADVGYAAPFFKAKPLKQSFIATSGLEIFKYDVKGDSVVVTRTPGPTKTLILKPQTPAEINAYFEQMNVSNSKFLTTLTIQKFFNKKLLRLSGDKLFGDGPERQLTEEEIEDVLVDRFGIYPRFYNDAKARLG